MQVTVQYAAVSGSHLSDSDAATVGPELDRITRERGADALAVVETARQPESPLHPYIEWDDPVAAEQWRLHQARGLLAHIAVVVKEADDSGPRETMRAFHVVRERHNDHTEARYHPVDVVVQKPEWAEQVRQVARSELRAFRHKYSKYEEHFRGDEALAKAFSAIVELDE